MSAASTTCPYCNAFVTPSPGGKAPCPRCGETVTVPDGTFTDTPPPHSPALPYRKPVEANRLTAAIIVTTMVVLAATGLVYALMTVNSRRDNDRAITRSTRRPILPPLFSRPDVEPSAPARLAGLGHMPQGVTFVAGLHAAELLRGPIGEKLRDAPLNLAGLEFSIDGAERWLGIPAGNIDTIVAGSVLESGGEANLTPPTVVVIRTLNPVGVLRLYKALNAKPAREKGGRSLSEGSISSVPVSLWLPTPNTVVIGIFLDLATLPERPAEGLERLVPELRTILEQRLPIGTAAWAAAHSSGWEKSPLLGALPLKKLLPLNGLAGIRTLAAWLPADEPYRALAAARCADEATAKRLELEIDRRKPVNLKHARDGAWLSLQLTSP